MIENGYTGGRMRTRKARGRILSCGEREKSKGRDGVIRNWESRCKCGTLARRVSQYLSLSDMVRHARNKIYLQTVSLAASRAENSC